MSGCPKGWDNVGPDSLNTAIPYLSFYLPAAVFSAGANDPALWSPISIGARDQRLDAWECENGVDSEIFHVFDVKNVPIKWSSPEFKARPIWTQINGAAPAPVEYVRWAVSFMGVLIGGSFDQNNNTNSYNLDSPVLGQYIKSGGNSGSGQNSVAISNFNGDSFVAGASNGIMVEIERKGGAANDTYGQSCHLLGLDIQYRTDFNNIAVWPT